MYNVSFGSKCHQTGWDSCSVKPVFTRVSGSQIPLGYLSLQSWQISARECTIAGIALALTSPGPERVTITQRKGKDFDCSPLGSQLFLWPKILILVFYSVLEESLKETESRSSAFRVTSLVMTLTCALGLWCLLDFGEFEEGVFLKTLKRDHFNRNSCTPAHLWVIILQKTIHNSMGIKVKRYHVCVEHQNGEEMWLLEAQASGGSVMVWVMFAGLVHPFIGALSHLYSDNVIKSQRPNLLRSVYTDGLPSHRSACNSAALGCHKSGDSQNKHAADPFALVMWCNRVNMEQKMKKEFPAPWGV